MKSTSNRWWCLVGVHDYHIEIKQVLKVIDINAIGTRIISRCACCGKITSKDIF